MRLRYGARQARASSEQVIGFCLARNAPASLGAGENPYIDLGSGARIVAVHKEAGIGLRRDSKGDI